MSFSTNNFHKRSHIMATATKSKSNPVAIVAVKASKPSIDISALTLPKGVEIKTTKTATSFFRNTKKAILKGRALELTNPIKELGDRVKKYSAKVIEKCHLGSVQGVLPGVKDTVDLQKILRTYFK